MGQNVASSPLTSIIAGQNIVYGYGSAVSAHSIQIGGPGYAIVQAGGYIDLGYSGGIQTTGNSLNPAALAADETGASLIVAAGFAGGMTPNAVSGFFDAPSGLPNASPGLHTVAIQAAALEKSGDTADAQKLENQEQSTVAAPFLGSGNQGKDITMTSSQITTVGGGNLFVITTGTLNVGTTALAGGSSGQSSGITTQTGGEINVFAQGDVNVNESRIMSFQGGDITVWSYEGSINAGKGDKAAVNAVKTTYVLNSSGAWVPESHVPPLGSGIRGVTYGTPAPPPGDIYLVALNGVIDAGEAGISGGNVFLSAPTVLNASNITSIGGTVGAPAASQGMSLGALSGTGDLSKGAVSSDTGALAQAQERVASAQPIEDMLVKWIDVKVISYDQDFGTEDSGDKSNKSR